MVRLTLDSYGLLATVWNLSDGTDPGELPCNFEPRSKDRDNTLVATQRNLYVAVRMFERHIQPIPVLSTRRISWGVKGTHLTPALYTIHLSPKLVFEQRTVWSRVEWLVGCITLCNYLKCINTCFYPTMCIFYSTNLSFITVNDCKTNYLLGYYI